MLVSCIVVSHNKPTLCFEAIQSVVNQTYQEWECLVVDSGILYDQDYFNWFTFSNDKRLTLIRSSETELTRKTKAMAPWCFNECLRQGKVKGELIIYLCDDDLLYPNAFKTFVDYVAENPNTLAMYASQDIGVIYPNGKLKIVSERLASKMAGKYCQGIKLDCEVDYLQFCHHRKLLALISDHEWWPEAKETESHADGLFMEKCGTLTAIYPINIKTSQNRRTPDSINVNTAEFLNTFKIISYHRRIIDGIKRRVRALIPNYLLYKIQGFLHGKH